MTARSRIPVLTVGLLSLTLSSGLLASRVLGAPTPASTDVARGKTLFMRDGCYTCHGTAGQGNRFAGPAIAPHPIPLQALLVQLRTPAYEMPAYAANVLSDSDAAAIFAYLSSIPVGKPASSIPLLRSVNGSNAKR
jgi:ubiquinol-cytochrome c reductase cytochrome c subunit